MNSQSLTSTSIAFVAVRDLEHLSTRRAAEAVPVIGQQMRLVRTFIFAALLCIAGASEAPAQATQPVSVHLNLQSGTRDLIGMDLIGHASFARVMIERKASANANPVIETQVYELATGKSLLPASLIDRPVFEISPSGRIVVLGSSETLPGAPYNNAYVEVIDLEGGKVLYTYGRGDGGIPAGPASFSDDGTTLLYTSTTAAKGTAWKLVHLPGAQAIREIPFEQLILSGTRPALTADGQFVYWNGGETLIVWEAKTARRTWDFSVPRGTNIVSAVFVAGQKRVRILQTEGEMVTLDAESGREIHRVQAPAMYYRLQNGMMGMTEDGLYAIRSGPDGLIYFDCDSGKPVGIFPTKTPPYPMPSVVRRFVPTRPDQSGNFVILQLPPITKLSPLPEGILPPSPARGQR